MAESNQGQVSKEGWRLLNDLSEIQFEVGSRTVAAVQSETTQNPEGK